MTSADRPITAHASPALAGAVGHALVWLVVGNAIGVMMAVLLLLPGLNPWLGEWTYGRWMMVHMNTALYGWCSLPMLGFLFQLYGADRGALSAWCRPVLWLWSGTLVVGSISWLSGNSSGKLFLDWTGLARVLFPLAMFGLWLLLLLAMLRNRAHAEDSGKLTRVVRIALLVILVAVPFAIYAAANPSVYPAINPDSGGPTGASQLESSLGVVLILLILPFGVTRRNDRRDRIVRLSWMVFIAEAALCALMNHRDMSHHRPAQYLGLATILVWLVLIPMYYARFKWTPAARRWRIATLWWWSGLVVSGWITFLPGILDRVKFTDALVGHSLVAVAGFLTALLVFIMIQLIGERDAWIFNRAWSFYAWNLGVLAYVVIISLAGWIEGANPAFTIVPGLARNSIYVVRLLTGISMLVASAEWLVAASALPAYATTPTAELSGESIA